MHSKSNQNLLECFVYEPQTPDQRPFSSFQNRRLTGSSFHKGKFQIPDSRMHHAQESREEQIPFSRFAGPVSATARMGRERANSRFQFPLSAPPHVGWRKGVKENKEGEFPERGVKIAGGVNERANSKIPVIAFSSWNLGMSITPTRTS